jgi:hypothetical protein
MKTRKYGPLSALLLAMLCLPVFSGAQVLFEKWYPASYDRTTRDVLPTSDGGYLLVGMANNSNPADCELYVMKTNGMGEMQWDSSYGGAKPDYAYSMVETHDGNYIIAGYTQSFGNGDYDMYLLKIAPDGRMLKQIDLGDGKNEEAREIIRTKDNKYVVVGTAGFESTTADQQIMVVKMDANLTVENTWFFGESGKEYGLGIKQTADDGFIISGQTFSKGNGGGDAYLLKISATGAKEWDQYYGGAQNDEAVGVVVNPDGSYVFAMRDSSSSADVDIKIYKVSSTGAEVWNMPFAGPYKDTPKTIEAMGNNEYIVGAISRSFNGAGSPDMWLLKIKDNGSTGTKVWERFYGDAIGHDHCHRAKAVSDGILAAGHTRNPTQKVYFLKLSLEGKLTVGLNENQLMSSDVMVFPNPVTGGVVNVKNAKHVGTEIGVYNILGERIHYSYVTAGNDGLIDLTSQPAGVYIINVSSANSTVTKKIVIR